MISIYLIENPYEYFLHSDPYSAVCVVLYIHNLLVFADWRLSLGTVVSNCSCSLLLFQSINFNIFIHLLFPFHCTLKYNCQYSFPSNNVSYLVSLPLHSYIQKCSVSLLLFSTSSLLNLSINFILFTFVHSQISKDSILSFSLFLRVYVSHPYERIPLHQPISDTEFTFLTSILYPSVLSSILLSLYMI